MHDVGYSPRRFNNPNFGSNDKFFQPKLVHEEAKDETQDCRGWETDPQSFCSKVGKHFIETEFKSTAAVKAVDVSPDGGCQVHFEDGFVLTIQKMSNHRVFVQVSASSANKVSRVRCYSYTCSKSGKLNLTITSCSD